ncbi:acyl-CoA thioesterase [Tenacibaculum finnmarkense]|uniref:acyl-CoA thioesterase n=1 Tax=Tenacibaculum finnmarkense TaxID=2781243 RepID=UPI00187B11CF|nr:acyl-CoA thioesterase [Tenacibaculum finnmarkense]MBE7645524.1 acyl-CoA thioesterase [Tenacibaculum finnmarkense genomovar ulcerans]MCD8400108.1 acyl-CoA thioesterase [Tenacibaculum finnmarkense genomovar ulcerans]MCG8795805.1 acyl-CoA thioesterase [Tenacibaculum finnmarkense]MCG8798204.1 acyl-CoA thioesterase [Tenacibaculum finnmarkense]MCG8812274.1 acyl-CoA thioesterase [Tenacibaculum finnmarkense]
MTSKTTNKTTRKFKHVEETGIIISELMLPSHANFSGKIHGGYILSLLDQIAFACASKHSGEYCVTASVDTVDFLNPIEVGELVTMKASVNYAGRTSMVVGIRVEAENIRTGVTKHCNSSYFTMVAKDKDGKSVQVPGLIVNDDIEIRRFLKAIKRIEMKKKRQEEFDSETFVHQNYTKDLEKYNVKIEL